MKFYNIILVLLSLSVFSYFKSLRKFLMFTYPIVGAFFAVFCVNFTETLLGKFGIDLKYDGVSRVFIFSVSISFFLTALKLIKDKKEISFAFSFLFLTSYATLSLTFLSRDLFNLYVLLEVLSVQAALMILENKNEKKLWASLKYLIIGSLGANIYLIGTVIYYTNAATFSLLTESNLPKIAYSLMIAGLMIRTGVFGAGMWLMQFHSNADDELSAILSGAFINGGIYAIKVVTEASKIDLLPVIGVMMAAIGGFFALFSQNYKRAVALSSSVHLGVITAFVKNSPIYVLMHSLSKTILFLNSSAVKKRSLPLSTGVLLYVAILSLNGAPFTLGGYAEKVLLKDSHILLKSLAIFALVSSSAGIMKSLLKVRFEKTLTPSILLIIPFLYPSFSFESLFAMFMLIIFMCLKIERRSSIIYGERLEDNLILAMLVTVVMLWCC